MKSEKVKNCNSLTEFFNFFQMIIDMIDPTNYNNNSLKDEFLGNIYRIVECCGADGYKDYTDRFDMSPHEECSDHRHTGGIYYEEGCSHKFLVWLKAWAGCALVLCLIGQVCH